MDVVDHARIIAYINTLDPAILGVNTTDKATIRALPRGVWNYNYLLKIGNRKFVLKAYQPWPAGKSMFMTNSGRREFEALKLVESLGIAPRPILFDDTGPLAGRDVTLYEYIEGDTLTYSERTMREAAEVYAKLHSLNADRAGFLERRDESLGALMSNVEREYAHYARRNDAPQALLQAFKKYLVLTKDCLAGKSLTAYPQAIIHADPVAGNVIVGPKLALIDWQAVMIGDPAFDVWAFSSAPFALWDLDAAPDEDQRRLFRQTYLSWRDDPTLEERIALKEPLYLLEYGIHLSTRYYDYKSGNMPSDAVAGREANFEKYGPNAEVALESLRQILG